MSGLWIRWFTVRKKEERRRTGRLVVVTAVGLVSSAHFDVRATGDFVDRRLYGDEY